MQQKVTRDVRIVFNLSIDMIIGCVPQKEYVVSFKRGEKIQASSPVLTADMEGKVHVGLMRVFTSTLQRQNDRKYKKKELKVRVVEVCSQRTTNLSYDLSKDMIVESFIKRKLILKDRKTSMAVYVKLDGVKEAFHNEQQSLHTASNSSFASYMREPSNISSSSSLPIDTDSYVHVNTPSIALSEYESVIDSLTGTPSEGRSEDIYFDVTESRTSESYAREVPNEYFQPPPPSSPSQTPVDMPKKGSGTQHLTKSILDLILEERHMSGVTKPIQSDLPSNREQPRPPPNIPSRRNVVSSSDPVQKVIVQICRAVRQNQNDDDKFHKVTYTPKGAQIAFEFYSNQTGEMLERFVVEFVSYVAVEVCQETRHIGEWLNLLTHLLYKFIAELNGENNLNSIQRAVLQFAKLTASDRGNFKKQGKELLQTIQEDFNFLSAVEIFWIAGLDYCATTLALISTQRVNDMWNNFSNLFPFSASVFMSIDEQILAATALLCSELHLALMTLIPKSTRTKNGDDDIRTVSPLYRIILLALVVREFEGIVTAISRKIFNSKSLHIDNVSYSALKVLKFLILWARRHYLLSVLSSTLMPLVAYCDLILLPNGLLQNQDYCSFLSMNLPSDLIAKISGNNSFQSISTSISPSPASDDMTFSVSTTLWSFTRKGYVNRTGNAEIVPWSLVEVLNGDEDEASRVLCDEELFHETGFNGLKETILDSNRIFSLLSEEA